MERPGFVSKNDIYQRSFDRHETSRFLNKIFKLKTSNRSDH